MLKTCTKIEDLVCENCIYSGQYMSGYACRLHPPSNDYSLVNNIVGVDDTCGSGQWYCELHRSKDDNPGPSPMYRTSGKSMAMSSFMDRIRENHVDDDGAIACNYLFKRLKYAADKNYFGICNDNILKLKSLTNVGIVCSSVFLTDKVIEFTIRAEVELM